MSTSRTTRARASMRSARRWGSGLLTVTVAGVALQAVPAHAVDAPVVTGPTGTVTGDVELTWDAVAGATSYEVQVDDKPDFTSPEWRPTTVGTLSVPTVPLASGTQYVRVRAKQGSTWSDWGQGVFNVGPVAGPDLVAPASGAELQQPGEPPLLRWTPVAGATSYTVEVDQDDDFVGAKTYTTKSTSFVVPDNQPPGVTYHWRVRATLATNILSNVSDSRTYTVLPLATPVMDTLNDVDITDVVLDWEPVPGAEYYELQVDDDYDFNSPVTGTKPLKVVGTRYSPATTYGNDEYYWRVRAVDADGNPTAWTRVRDGDHHEFDRVWPDQPGLVHPVGSPASATVTKVVGDDLYYEWTPVPQASLYEVWLSTDPNFTYPSPSTWKCQVVGTTYTPGEKGDACMPGGEGGAYYWKVRALDLPYGGGGVEGIFSETQLFVYEDSTRGAPGDVWQFDDSARGRTVDVPTADWEPVDNTFEYRIELVEASGAVVQKATTLSTSWTAQNKVDATRGPYRWRITGFDHDGHPTTTVTTGWTFHVSESVSASPAPLTPIDQPATYDAPNLRWGALTGADHYRVWVRDTAATAWYSPSYSPLTKNAWTYPAATDTGENFLREGTYEWFVQAFDELGNHLGDGPSSTFTVLPLDAVTGQRLALTGKALDLGEVCAKSLVSSSSNWCDAVPSTPVLDWSPVSHAAYYRVHVSRDANFTTGTLTDRVPATSNTRWAPRVSYANAALPDSQASTAYYWFIQPCKANGLCGPDPRSTISPARSAFRKTSPPVKLESPAHVPDPVSPTSVVATSEVTFRWEDYLATNRATTYNETGEKSYQSARNYRIEVSTVPTFAGTLVDSAEVDQPTYTSAGKLYPEGTLYWRVQAIDADANKLTWSETRTLVKRSPKPELVGPLLGDGQVVTGGTPLRWKAQPFAASYDVQVAADEDENFSDATLVVNRASTRTAYTTGSGVKALKPSSRPYVWRVRRTDASGLKGPWSETGRFMVDAEGVLQTAPDVDAVVGQRALAFRWEPVAATSRYRVTYRKRDGTGTTSADTAARAFAPTALLVAGTAYEWRVQALDTDGQVLGESGWRAFTVGGTPTASALPTLTGTGQLGTRLQVVDPAWSVPGVRNSYEWQRDGVAIAGADGTSYEVTSDDVGRSLRVKVTGTSPEFGTGTAVSAAVTGLPGPGPVATTQPRVSGSGVVGTTLTVSPVAWGAAGVSVAYQWHRDGRAISRATAETYTVTPTDVGADLTVRVSGSLPGRETTTVVSNGVTGVAGAAPTTLSPLALRGTGTVGSTLTAPDLVWDLAGVGLTYQWLRNGVAVPGRTGRTYVLADADADALVSLRITGEATGYAPAVLFTGSVAVSRPAPQPTSGPSPTTGPTTGPTAGPSPTASPTKPTTGPTSGAKVASKTTLTAKKKVRTKGKKTVRVTVSVKVRATGAQPRGTVKVYAGKKLVGTGTLKADGTVKVKLKALKRGTYKLKVTYLGKGTVKKSTSKVVKVKVVR